MAVLPRTPEIDKYIAALAKDPKSKVFAALAEAYRKAGALDEAIALCQDGLKRNPQYLSGMVALGRCYYDKGMKPEAKQQFEKVVKASPDNVIAQRILGDIYYEEGKKPEAIKAFKLILALNPKDADARERLDILEGRKAAPPPSSAAVQAQAPAPPKVVQAAAAAQPLQEVKQPPEQVPSPAVTASEGFDIFDVRAPQAAPPGPKTPPQVTAAAAAGGTQIPEVPPPSVQEGRSETTGKIETAPPPSTGAFDDFEEAFKEFDIGKPPVPAPTSGSPGTGVAEAASGPPPASVSAQAIRAEEPAPDRGADVAPPPAELVMAPGKEPEAGIDLDDLLGKPKETEVIPPGSEPQPQPAVSAAASRSSMTTSTLADLYLKQGYYDKALSIYQAMLSEGQDSRELRDKVAMVQRKIAEGRTRTSSVGLSPAASPEAAARASGLSAQPASRSAIDAAMRTGSLPKVDRGNGAIEENIRRLSQWLDKIKAGG